MENDTESKWAIDDLLPDWRRKRIRILIFSSLILSFIAFVLFGIWGAHDYVSRVPKITPKQTTLSVPAGTVLKPEDIADISCKGPYTAHIWLVPDGYGEDGTSLNWDSTELNVGAGEKNLIVRIKAQGVEASESDPIEIQVVKAK